MANQQLEAQVRTVIGKKVSRLRREGRVPGIIYGPVIQETVPVSVDRRDFVKFFRANGHATLLDLTWDGNTQSVFIREVQLDPVRQEPLHIDFFAPNLRRPVRAMVPLFLHNPVNTSEAILTEQRTEIEVEALPADIPHQIDIDVSGLSRPGDAIRVGDLSLPRNVVATTDAAEIVVLMEAVYRAPEAVEAAEAAVPEAAPAAAVSEAPAPAESAQR